MICKKYLQHAEHDLNYYYTPQNLLFFSCKVKKDEIQVHVRLKI